MIECVNVQNKSHRDDKFYPGTTYPDGDKKINNAEAYNAGRRRGEDNKG